MSLIYGYLWVGVQDKVEWSQIIIVAIAVIALNIWLWNIAERYVMEEAKKE